MSRNCVSVICGLSLLVLCGILRTAAQTEDTERQEFRGYTNLNCIYGGGFGEFGRYDYDLKFYPPNDNSALAVSGVGNWIFYDLPGYQGDSEFVQLRSPSHTECVPFTALAGRASSLKFVGDRANYSLPSITLYEGPNFTGAEFYVADSNPKTLFNTRSSSWTGYSEPFGSFIITGDSSSCWTLYEAVGFQRDSICVCGYNSPLDSPLLVQSSPFPPQHRIGSVRKGCRGAGFAEGDRVFDHDNDGRDWSTKY